MEPRTKDRSSRREQDDVLASDRLMERYGAHMRLVARRFTRSAEDAEDVVQDALVKVIEKGHTYTGKGKPMAWIQRVVRNEAFERSRRARVRRAVSLDALGSDSHEERAGLDDRYENKELRDAVRNAIMGLQPPYLSALRLFHLEGLSYEESAEASNIALGTFKVRLHRARKQLREALSARLGPSLPHAA